MSTETTVTRIPDCDLCKANGGFLSVTVTNPAYADARIPAAGSWGYVCKEHFDSYGCQLGTGKGQRLVQA